MGKILTEKTEIEDWLKKNNIKNYQLIEDKEYGYVVNVTGNVKVAEYMINENNENKKVVKKTALKQIPIKFNRIEGNFDCSELSLETLKNCPEEVYGNFFCNTNQLKNLEYFPKKVTKGINCSHNGLKNLIGVPNIVSDFFNCDDNRLITLQGSPSVVMNSFSCNHNKLTSLEFCPITVIGDFHCQNNKIENLLFCPKYVKGGFWALGNKNLKHLPAKAEFPRVFAEHLKYTETTQFHDKLTEDLKTVNVKKKLKI